MNSKGIGADMVFAWPAAEIGPMDAKLAGKILADGKNGGEIEKAAKEFAEKQNNVESAAARGYVDEIITPQETRKHLVYAFEMLFE